MRDAAPATPGNHGTAPATPPPSEP